MPRRTPEQELVHQMQIMKDMGVTINVTPAHGVPEDPTRPSSIIAAAAKEANIYYEKSN